MNILITAIGSFSADCVVHALKTAGHRVVGCDIYPAAWHAVASDCDKVYQVPFATDAKYVANLIDICTKESIEYVFPLTDLEIDVLNNARDKFDGVATLCLQTRDCLALARDKYKLSLRFADDEVINVPRFTLLKDIDSDFPMPAILKPINGRSSEGVRRVYSTEQLHGIEQEDSYIVQQLLGGFIYTVDYVRDTKGHECAIPRRELLRTKNGAGTTVQIITDPVLQQMASHVGRTLGVVGCVNMEFIGNGGQYFLIDVNPRFSAGVAFSHLMGYDMVLSHLQCFCDGSIAMPVPLREVIMTKRYHEEILSVASSTKS